MRDEGEVRGRRVEGCVELAGGSLSEDDGLLHSRSSRGGHVGVERKKGRRIEDVVGGREGGRRSSGKGDEEGDES